MKVSKDTFDLFFTKKNGCFKVKLLDSPSGESQFVNLYVDDILNNEDFHNKNLVRTLDINHDAINLSANEMGRYMFEAVFRDEIKENFYISINIKSSLVIKLRLTETPELLDFPWELLYDSKRHFFWGLSNPESVKPIHQHPA